MVTRLTNLHEQSRAEPWAVSDAPEPFISSQVRAIIGVRLPISRLDGKRKLSQNRSAQDRAGLSKSERSTDRVLAKLIPK